MPELIVSFKEQAKLIPKDKKMKEEDKIKHGLCLFGRRTLYE